MTMLSGERKRKAPEAESPEKRRKRNMKMNHKGNMDRRNEVRTENRGRERTRRSGWMGFYTHNAVPAMFAAQECFKQEQR